LDNIAKDTGVLSEAQKIDDLLRALANGEKTIPLSPSALEKTKGKSLSDQLQFLAKGLAHIAGWKMEGSGLFGQKVGLFGPAQPLVII
jgi:hypothetical protein